MERLIVQLILSFSSDLTSSLINCTMLNLSSQKLSIENQSLSDSPFCNMLISECWSFILISSKKFCDTEKYEELEMDTDSLYLALSEENLEDIILPEKRNEWEAIRSRDCTESFTANATGNLFPRTCCTADKKQDKRERGLFKEQFRCSEMLCLCGKTYCCCDRKSNKYKFSSEGLNKRTLEDCGDGPMSKYPSVRRGSRSYFNQQRISNNETDRGSLLTDKIGNILFLPKTSFRRRWNTH